MREYNGGEPTSQRVLVTCLSVLFAQASITLYLPALPKITEDLQGSSAFASMTLTFFFVGMALPMLLWGRLCESHGACRVLTVALLIYGSSGLLIATVSEQETFLVIRFTQGVAAGGVSVCARSWLREHLAGHQLTKALSALSLCFVLSLGITQFLGSLLDLFLGWRAGFLLLGGASVLLGGSLIAFWQRHIPRTPGTPSWQTYIKLLKTRSFICPALAGGFGYGIIVTFNSMAPDLFQSQFNWSSLEFGLLGWPVSVSYLLGTLMVYRMASGFGDQHRLFRSGLLVLMGGAGLMGIGTLFWTGNPSWLWLSYCVMLVGQGISYPLCQSLASQHIENGSQAMALMGLLHQMIAAAVGVFVSLLEAVNSQALVLACVALAVIAWLGGRVRAQ